MRGKRNWCRRLFPAAGLLTAGCCFLGMIPVSANSAQTEWEGSAQGGIVVSDSECPLIVENELLTFDIQEFPKTFYESLDEYLAYSGKVTAEYTFYNPSDYTVRATLAFPFGRAPDYGYIYDYDTGESCLDADVRLYSITADGQELDKKLRFTFQESGEAFDLDEELNKLEQGIVKDEFYRPDMPVTKYTYEFKGIDNETYNAAQAMAVIDDWSGRTKYFFGDTGGYSDLTEHVEVSVWAENGNEFTFYVIGDEPEVMPEWVIYADGTLEKEIAGEVVEKSAEKLTVEQLARSICGASEYVNSGDLYNAVIAMLNQSEQRCGVIMNDFYEAWLLESLMRWYEYEIVLEPGQRLVNRVEAPIYPAVSGTGEAAEYTYTYLLSPARTWKEFGSLDVEIDTPFHLTDSKPEGMEEREGGYSLALESLPEGELSFVLRSSDRTEAYISSLFPAAAAAVVTVTAAVGIGAAAILIVIRKQKKGKRDKK